MATTRTRRPAQTPATQENDIVTDVQTAPAPQTDATPANGTPNGTAPDGAAVDGATEANGKSKKNTAPIQITVPLDLKTMIEQRAEQAGKTAARWILENVATDLEFTLPEATRTASPRGGVKMTDVFAKDLTPEQKRQRLADAKTLLDGLAKGVIDLADIRAKLGV